MCGFTDGLGRHRIDVVLFPDGFYGRVEIIERQVRRRPDLGHRGLRIGTGQRNETCHQGTFVVEDWTFPFPSLLVWTRNFRWFLLSSMAVLYSTISLSNPAIYRRPKVPVNR